MFVGMQGQLSVVLHYLMLFITQSKYANTNTSKYVTAISEMCFNTINKSKQKNLNVCRYARSIKCVIALFKAIHNII